MEGKTNPTPYWSQKLCSFVVLLIFFGGGVDFLWAVCLFSPNKYLYVFWLFIQKRKSWKDSLAFHPKNVEQNKEHDGFWWKTKKNKNHVVSWSSKFKKKTRKIVTFDEILKQKKNKENQQDKNNKANQPQHLFDFKQALRLFFCFLVFVVFDWSPRP